LKFGIKLPHSGPGAGPDYMLRWAQFAEALGFHHVMVGDHIGLTPDVLAEYPAPYYGAFTTIAWLAGQTGKIELGTTAIVVPYRHPMYLAHPVANVDQLSGGRFILGVAHGHSEGEFEALGVPYHQRGAITNDYLAAVKVLLSDDVASYEGRFVSFRDVMISPKSVQSPHPPIWVGGSSDAALRRAVRLGDGWHPVGFSVKEMKDTLLPRLRGIADREGLPVPALCPRIRCTLTESPQAEDERRAGVGTLDQIHRDLESLQEMGAEYVLLATQSGSPEAAAPGHHEESWRTLATVAEKVIDLEKETVR